MRRDPEKAKAWRARSKRMRARSLKTSRQYVERRKLVAKMLGPGALCAIRWDERCRGRPSTVHEKHTRAQGGDILDPDNCVAVCDPCHMAVHDNPAEAARRGWLRTKKDPPPGGGGRGIS